MSKDAARQFFALAGLAATELFRQPVVFLLILSGTVFVILTPLAISFQLGQQARLAVDSSLAFEFMFGIVLAGYAACSTLHQECRSGTILIVFSKPVSRLMFFLAKYLAITGVIAFFVLCIAAAALVAARLTPRNFQYDTLGMTLLWAIPLLSLVPAALLNYFRRRPFVPCALGGLVLALAGIVTVLGMVDSEGHRAAFGSQVEWHIVPACALEGIALLILAAIALSLATRLPAPSTIAVLAIMLFAGLISDHLVSLLPPWEPIRFGLKMLLPDIQAFWPADTLSGGGLVPVQAIMQAILYAVSYTAGVLCLGYAAFRDREF